MFHVECLAIGLLALAVPPANAADVNTCAQQRPCLTFQENGCIGGSRTVCLGTNSAAAGCILGPDTINNMCSIVNGSPVNSVVSSSGQTCGVFAGGSTATFAVSDTATSGGTLIGANVLIVGSTTASRSGSCRAEQTQRCPNAQATNTIWTFSVTSCDCTCNTWSTWTSCQSNCMRTRTRTCTAPSGVSCAGQESESEVCRGGSCLGCSCSPTWSSWSSCSSTCMGGISMRTRQCSSVLSGVTCEPIRETRNCGIGNCFDGSSLRCNCGGWTGWAACSNRCGQGTQTRTRVCSPIPGGPPTGMCPANVFPRSQTQSCTGRRCPGVPRPPSVPVPPFVPVPRPSPSFPGTGCSCGPWISNGCSVDCGEGVTIQTRTCSGHCSNVIQSRYANCQGPNCFHSRTGSRGGHRRRNRGENRVGRRRPLRRG